MEVVNMILKAATFNTHHGETIEGVIHTKKQASIFKTYKPDIIFIQETDMYAQRSKNENQIYNFSKYVDLGYRTMGTTIKLGEGFYGDGIISRFPVNFSANFLMPSTDISHEQRGVLYNRISFGTTKINLFSVHMSTYEEERILSAQELIRIINKLDKEEIVLIGGDFNVGVTRLGKGKYNYQPKEYYEEYEILKTALKQINNTENTWFSDLGNGCIDTMFYSDNITLKKTVTIDSKGLSDHNAVYAEFDV